MHRPAPKVLLMLGSGRSGSTLLERALGEVPGVAALGETVHMWERGLRQHELCGCGLAFDECDFWIDVGKFGFDGWHALDADELIAMRHKVVRTRCIPELMTTGATTGWRRSRDRLAGTLEQVYQAASEVSGAELLVDSSKLPAYAALLRHAEIDLRCLFVVRDPRGVAYSWAKSVERPEVVGERVLMPRYGAARAAANWTKFAAVAKTLRGLGVPMRTVRYEDFLSRPKQTLSDVLAFADHRLDQRRLTHVNERSITLTQAHTVAGNPMRFTVGEVALRRDDAWRARLPIRDRLVVETLTTGVRRALGYE